LQWMMFTPLLRAMPGSAVLHSDLLWRLMYAHTR